MIEISISISVEGDTHHDSKLMRGSCRRSVLNVHSFGRIGCANEVSILLEMSQNVQNVAGEGNVDSDASLRHGEVVEEPQEANTNKVTSILQRSSIIPKLSSLNHPIPRSERL